MGRPNFWERNLASLKGYLCIDWRAIIEIFPSSTWQLSIGTSLPCPCRTLSIIVQRLDGKLWSEVCVYPGTVFRRTMRQGIFLRLPCLHQTPSFRMFAQRSEMSFSKDVTIATGRLCIGTAFHSVGKIPQIQLSIYDVPSSTSTARLSTIQNHVRVWRSQLNMWGAWDLLPGLTAGQQSSVVCHWQV